MALSPMMQQYLKIKEQYSDTLIFFRLGDFYEMFFDDAKLVSRELELTLTGRDCGLEERAPMCGIPYHALDTYLARLIEKGHKVAICEQLSDPSAKGIVERDVVRVVTPGTVMDSTMLPEDKNNYLACIYLNNNKIGMSWSDISTGEINHCLIESPLAVKLNDLLARIKPAEILCNSEMLAESINLSLVKYGQICPFSLYNDEAFEFNTAKKSIESQLGNKSVELIKQRECVCSCGALLAYVNETQKRNLVHLQALQQEDETCFMLMDNTARKTLELFEGNDGRKKGSLLGIIDKTKTGMGARKLRHWLEKPSLDEKTINDRLDGVSELYSDVLQCDKISSVIAKICDIERIVSKISYGSVQPKDCIALGDSLELLPELICALQSANSEILKACLKNLPNLDDVCSLLKNSLIRSPSAKDIGLGIIKSDYDETLSQYREIGEKAQEILAELEQAERDSTGIKNLKISYNKVFGYFIEVTKSQVSQVPYRYIRKQTIANGERYITEELKTIEQRVLNAEQYAKDCETDLYNEIIIKMQKNLKELLQAAAIISTIDCIAGFAVAARQHDFTRPKINSNIDCIKISEGRHCVVENVLKNEQFVPNDAFLNNEDRIMLITGPNMAGKSVYMRQVALITIMAHIGCFVPAKNAEICLTDRIFTRVGASDDLSTGRSTFMVEMSEVSYIIENATSKSLILLDEIGRGTSTYDGLSIAWAIMEYLAETTKAKTLFSTHYHELTDLEDKINCVKNYKLTVREFEGNILFLRKLMRGSANKSFGIEVAGLAGLPKAVILRAKKLLALLENNEITRLQKAQSAQVSMFTPTKLNEILPILKELNLEDVSPRAAWDILADLKEKVGVNE